MIDDKDFKVCIAMCCLCVKLGVGKTEETSKSKLDFFEMSNKKSPIPTLKRRSSALADQLGDVLVVSLPHQTSSFTCFNLINACVSNDHINTNKMATVNVPQSNKKASPHDICSSPLS